VLTTNTIINPTTGLPTIDPFLWDKESGMQDLGTFGGTIGCAVNLNNRGQVVGYSNLPGDQTAHPFLWTKPGLLRDLGTLGGNYGFAIWANEAGEVVGSATIQDGAIHGFLWKKGVMIDLGTLSPFPNSDAEWINSNEQVVGKAASSDFSVQIAVLWENGNPAVDLNTLIPQGSGLQLTEARNINDRGEIAVSGVTPAGNIRAALLIPCDEHHPGVEGRDYSMVEASTAMPEARPVVSDTARPALPPLLRRMSRFHIPDSAVDPRN
jgi:probable HAF family extracellular repeat protein